MKVTVKIDTYRLIPAGKSVFVFCFGLFRTVESIQCGGRGDRAEIMIIGLPVYKVVDVY